MNKEALIEKHRDINVFDDWWEYVYEDFKKRLRALGIGVEDMWFSGFWSQGDGACFKGSVHDWEKFLPVLEYPKDKHPLLHEFFEDYGSFSCDPQGRYCTLNGANFSYGIPDPEREYDEEDFKDKAEIAILNTYDYESIEKAAIEQCKDWANELYRALEKEYDYLTSDEAVWEAIEANELEEEDDEDVRLPVPS